MLLTALGALAVLVALLVPPRIDKCIDLTPPPSRLPLKAFLLLDASASVDDSGWEEEKNAAEEIINAFGVVVADRDTSLHVGVGQFSTESQPEADVSDDVSSVVGAIRNMQQVAGTTVYSEGLRLCHQKLSAYTLAGSRTFDVCVLVTDGENSPDDSTDNILPLDTALFGIFVGQSPTGYEKLREITTCGAANHSSACHFFAAATSFDELRRSAAQVANTVAKGSDAARGVPVVDEPAPAWLALSLLGALPLALWWIYLQLPERRPRPPPSAPREADVRDPLRLRVAGRNEQRGSAPGQSEMSSRNH